LDNFPYSVFVLILNGNNLGDSQMKNFSNRFRVFLRKSQNPDIYQCDIQSGRLSAINKQTFVLFS